MRLEQMQRDSKYYFAMLKINYKENACAVSNAILHTNLEENRNRNMTFTCEIPLWLILMMKYKFSESSCTSPNTAARQKVN